MGGCTSKVSICIFLRRLLELSTAKKRIAFLYSLALVLIVYNTLEMITILIQCRPMPKLWNRKINGSCWKPNTVESFEYAQGGMSDYVSCFYLFSFLISSALSAFAAFALSIFPIFIIKDLQMNTRTKIALSLLMGAGILY